MSSKPQPATTSRCRTPGCPTLTRQGRKFCATHQKFYDRIRLEVAENQRDFYRTVRRTKKKAAM